MKILKFLTGGLSTYASIANPFLALSNTSTATKASASSSDDGLIDKSLLNKLYNGEGITSDVNEFSKLLGDIEYNSLITGRAPSVKQIRSLEASINNIVRNRKMFDKAIEKAEKQEALGDYAIGNDGGLYCINSEGKLNKVSIAKYDRDKDGQVLTVDELINFRENDKNFAFNDDIIKLINGSIGTQKINDYIFNLIKQVGDTTNTSDAYLTLGLLVGRQQAHKPTESELQNIQALSQALSQLGADAIFKNRQIVSSKNMQQALRFISKNLPRDMLIQLQGRYVASGGEYSLGDAHIEDILIDALNMSNQIKTEDTLSFDAGINKAAGTTAGTRDLNRNLGVLELLVLGTLGKRDFSIISRSNPTASMTLHGSGVGSLADYNNHIVDKTPLSIAMKTGLASVVDRNNVFVGDLKLPPGAFDTILYDGGDVINIWAPVDGNGNLDLELLQLFNEVQKIISRNPQLTPEDKTALLQQHNLDGYFDGQNVFHGGSRMAQFLVMTGLTSDEVVDPSENIYADKMSKQDKDLEMDQIDRIYGLLNKGIKDKDQQFKFLKGWFDWSTDLIKAPIFMKLNTTAQVDVGTFSGKGPLVQTPSYASQIAYDQMRYSQQRPLNTTSSSVLYDE